MPATRNLVSVPPTIGNKNGHSNNGSVPVPVSENGSKIKHEISKNLVAKAEPPNEDDTNKENERPELNLDIDISGDEAFQDLMASLEADVDLNY